MSKDLGLVGNQFGTAVSVLYATYTTFEPVCKSTSRSPCPMLTPRCQPSQDHYAQDSEYARTAYVPKSTC